MVLQAVHPTVPEWPLTCGFSIPYRVKTVTCPPRVRARHAAHISAARSHAPVHESPRESDRVPFLLSHCFSLSAPLP